VLEGSTLGGTFISRHLATLPDLAATGRLQAFSPYGADTGAMWHAFRRFTRERTQEPQRVVAAAGTTFRSLAEWCAPVVA
jgi:heme oxygenase